MHYSPVRHSPPESKLSALPFDLHVLGMPPAFNLSQDQTLQFIAEAKHRVEPESETTVSYSWHSYHHLRTQTHDVSAHTSYLIQPVKEQARMRSGQTINYTDIRRPVNSRNANFRISPKPFLAPRPTVFPTGEGHYKDASDHVNCHYAVSWRPLRSLSRTKAAPGSRAFVKPQRTPQLAPVTTDFPPKK